MAVPLRGMSGVLQTTPFAPVPLPPQRQFSFTDWSVNNPAAPQPGDRLDSEFDRTNMAVTATVAWAETSLATDGTLRPASVGQPQLVPGLFDWIASDAIAQVQPYVDQAHAYATSAAASANTASAQAGTATASATQAGGSAADAAIYAGQAGTSANAANQSAISAADSLIDTDNYANDALGSRNEAYDYSILAQAWAEHMPDTIPPNILAVMNITGDHWSSRWWANHAAEAVQGATENLDEVGQGWVDTINDTGQQWIGAFQTLYLGAFYTPPTTDAFGNPVAVGAVYYNMVLEAPYVWNGVAWVPLITPSPSQIYKYLYVATAGQTVFSGADRNGNTLVYNSANKQQVSVWRKGLLLTPVDEYASAVNRITLVAPAAAGDIVQVYVESVPQITLNWTTRKLDTSHWTTTGGTLIDTNGQPVAPAAASDVFISVDGVWQNALKDYVVSSNIITFVRPIELDAVTFGLAILPIQQGTTTVPAVTQLDTSAWAFNGSVRTFNLVDMSGSPVDPIAPVNLLISLDGVWQNAVIDYATSGTSITFTIAPEADAAVFGIAGLPAFVTTTAARGVMSDREDEPG